MPEVQSQLPQQKGNQPSTPVYPRLRAPTNTEPRLTGILPIYNSFTTKASNGHYVVSFTQQTMV